MQEIFADAASNRTVPNRTLRRVIRTGVDGKTPYLSDISVTSAYPPSGVLRVPVIGNKWQSNPQKVWKSDKLDATVDGNFTNNPIAPPVLTLVLIDRLSECSSRDLYARCGVHLATDSVNAVVPNFLDHGLSTVNALNKGADI